MSLPPPSKPDDRHLRTARWPWIGAGSVLVVFIAVVLFLIFTPQANVWTNDAYVQVHYAQISPRISGKIKKILITDNQPVKAGKLIVELDDEDETASLHQAQAQLEEAVARLANSTAMLAQQPAIIAQAKAQVAVIRAELGLSLANKNRFDKLAGTGAGSEQQRQQADSVYSVQLAQLAAATADVESAERQMDVLKAAQDAAQAGLDASRAAVAQADLNLSYTKINAPLAGMVDALSVQVGDYVSPGQTLMTVVPLNQLFILANYRETALRHVLPGQKVKIHVDAYNIDLKGIVEGLAPTTGALYSPIPPANATGNFTKIVQRLPVKILILPGQPLAHLLRAGMSVETTIHTNLADVVNQQRKLQTPLTTHIDTNG